MPAGFFMGHLAESCHTSYIFAINNNRMKERIYAGTYTLRVGDINYGGHMGNDRALLLFHDARLDFLAQLGFSESNIGGPGIIMSEAHVYFKKEAFRGDSLEVYVHVDDIREVSFVMHYSVLCRGAEVLRGNTRLIAFDYENRKVVKIPPAFLNRISG